MSIKKTYLVTDMRLNAFGADGLARETGSEKTALKKATQLLSTSNDSEVWVWKLSHVLSKPDLKPIIDKAD